MSRLADLSLCTIFLHCAHAFVTYAAGRDA